MIHTTRGILGWKTYTPRTPTRICVKNPPWAHRAGVKGEVKGQMKADHLKNLNKNNALLESLISRHLCLGSLLPLFWQCFDAFCMFQELFRPSVICLTKCTFLGQAYQVKLCTYYISIHLPDMYPKLRFAL